MLVNFFCILVAVSLLSFFYAMLFRHSRDKTILIVLSSVVYMIALLQLDFVLFIYLL